MSFVHVEFSCDVNLNDWVVNEVKIRNADAVCLTGISYLNVQGFEKNHYRIYPDHHMGYTRRHLLNKLAELIGDKTVSSLDVYVDARLLCVNEKHVENRRRCICH